MTTGEPAHVSDLLGTPGRITALVGGGGKTTLLHGLGTHLGRRAVLAAYGPPYKPACNSARLSRIGR